MTTVKAVKKTIQVAGLPVDVFQFPDGHYELSQTSVGEAIGKHDKSFRQFATSKRPEALPFKGLTFRQVSYEGHHIPVKSAPIALATIYWSYWASKGDKQALALVAALASEAIERRADSAFDVQKTEQQYETQTTTLRLELIDKLLGLHHQAHIEIDYDNIPEENCLEVYHQQQQAYAEYLAIKTETGWSEDETEAILTRCPEMSL